MTRADTQARKRAIIIDDDGDIVYADEARQGPEAFLSLRMRDCLAAGVDSVAWCVMWGIGHKGGTPLRYWQTQRQARPFQPNMPDPTPVITGFGRAHDIEVFGSIRMNDCHDAFGIPLGRVVYPLKVDHPDWLIGQGACRPFNVDAGLENALWSGMDYAREQVRTDRLWWIDHSARNYDFDGIDLNFFRMPVLFKLGKEAENIWVMNDFVRQARRRIDEVGAQRGRRLLMGVRVPGTIESCLRIGIDIETWLRDGLVDRLLTGGGYVCYSTPAEQLIRLGHRYNVPVYPCINCPGAFGLGGDSLRAAASNLWWAGADGLYLWNFQYLPVDSLGHGRVASHVYQEHLGEIADPKRLTWLDKSFPVNQRAWPQYQRASADVPLPVVLGPRPAAIPVRIGDDVPDAVRRARLGEATLRLQLQGAVAGDRIAVAFNDQTCELTVGDEVSLAVPLEPRAIKQGVNQVSIAASAGPARGKLTLEHVRVDVRYRS